MSFQTNILLAAKQISDKLRSMNATATIVQIASSDSSLYDELISDATLRKKTQKLFNDGHHARAVEEAYKLIDNAIKKKSGINDTGQKLMNTAFSVGNPVLRLNGGKNTSEKDEQQGYMQIFAGVMTGIRNPRAHESDWEDTERRALQLIVFANHLLERVSLANKNTVE